MRASAAAQQQASLGMQIPSKSASSQITPSHPTPPQQTNMRKKRAAVEMDLNYCEYNLSTMVDSKGGFLVEESPIALNNPEKEKRVLEEPPIPNIDPSSGSLCIECQSPDIDLNYLKYYSMLICKSCRDKYPEKYSLLTKTECKTVELFIYF